MTKQLQVLLALKALVAAALPAAMVLGFDGDSSVPEVIGAGGLVIGQKSDPGEPEVDIGSSAPYNYMERIPLEIAAAAGDGGTTLDAMLLAIGAGIRADRELGGLCDWLEGQAAVREDLTTDDVTFNWADVIVVAHYSTSDPLG